MVVIDHDLSNELRHRRAQEENSKKLLKLLLSGRFALFSRPQSSDMGCNRGIQIVVVEHLNTIGSNPEEVFGTSGQEYV